MVTCSYYSRASAISCHVRFKSLNHLKQKLLDKILVSGFTNIICISEYDDSIVYQTFSLNCNGAAGDMIYITDLGIKIGHGKSEVFVMEFTELKIGEWRSKGASKISGMIGRFYIRRVIIDLNFNGYSLKSR